MSQRKKNIVSQEDIIKQQLYINELRNQNEQFEKDSNYKTFYIQTYGCQMNEHDSENLKAMFDLMELTEADSQNDADIIIYNTCAVRENAELKVYGNLHALKKLKNIKKHLILAVCGCMMQQPHVVEEIKNKFPHVSMVFGTHNLYKFPEMLMQYLNNFDETIIDVWDIDGSIIEGLPTSRKFDIKAFVNIMYGCNNFCTYCIVPYTRGRERSREPLDIINEVKVLAKNGVKEITLLGQNVNSYGNSFESTYCFADLLSDLNYIDGIMRIRFMTSHPKDISDDVIEAVAKLEKVCESIHLPVQSGSSKVLKDMNRKYSKEDYLNLVDKIKTTIHDVSLTTDIMVGFPGESEDDFLETIDIVKKVEFDSAFMYIYSLRKGTKAEEMHDHIGDATKKERFKRLLDAANKITVEKNKAYKDKIVEVLVEGYSKKDSEKLMGRTRQNKLVNFTGNPDMIGMLVHVKITDPKLFSLNGIAL